MSSIEFLKLKIADTEKALKARKQGAEAWAGGTDKEWRAVGCKKNKSERMAASEMETQITAKVRIELDHYWAILSIVEAAR